MQGNKSPELVTGACKALRCNIVSPLALFTLLLFSGI